MDALSLVVVLALQSASTPPPRASCPGGAFGREALYRELKQGEECVEGILQRVECPTGRPVTFVVKLKDRVANTRRPASTSVSLRFSADFKGPMSCGGRAPADPV